MRTNFYQKRVPHTKRVFQSSHQVGVVEFCLLQFSTSHLVDPLHSLTLRVNDQREVDALLYDQCIIRRMRVLGKTFAVKLKNFMGVGKRVGEIDTICEFDSVFGAQLFVLVYELRSERGVESPIEGD